MINEETGTPSGSPKVKPTRIKPARLVLLVSGGTLALVTFIFALLVLQGYFETREEGERSAVQNAELIARNVRVAIGSSFAQLDELSQRADLDALPTAPEAGAALVAPVTLAVYDAAGTKVWAGDTGGPVAPDSIEGSDLSTSLTASQRAVSVLDPAAGDGYLLAVGRRLDDGLSPGGVIALLIDDRFIAAIAAPLQLGGQSTVSLLRADGWVLARMPPLPEPLKLSNPERFQQDQSGFYHSDSSPADGVARIVGFSRVDDLGLIALASIGRDNVLTDLWTATFIVTLLMAPIAIGQIASAALASRLLRDSEKAQATLQAALDRNETLFREIHHRVKNNLQSVAALLQLQPIDPEIKAAMGQRLSAMAAVHEHMYRNNQFDTVEIGGYLRNLIAVIVTAQGDQRIKITDTIEDLTVERDVAMPLALLANEVITNALKHAFAPDADGEIKITVQRNASGGGELVVEDNGAGFDPSVPSGGMGRRLTNAFATQVGGTVRVSSEPGRSRIVVDFELADPERSAEGAAGPGRAAT